MHSSIDYMMLNSKNLSVATMSGASVSLATFYMRYQQYKSGDLLLGSLTNPKVKSRNKVFIP